jgi:cell division protein DivIC
LIFRKFEVSEVAANSKRKKITRVARRPSLMMRIIIGLICVLAIASGIAFYFDQEEQLDRIMANRQTLEKQLDEAYSRNGELLALQDMVDTDEYVEKVARDQLGMVRPDEIVFEDN